MNQPYIIPPSPQSSMAAEQYYPQSNYSYPQHQYPSDSKLPSDDPLSTPNLDPIYPPLPATNPHSYVPDPSVNLRPSLTIKTSSSHKPSTSSIDLESTLSTGDDRTYHDAKPKIASDDETGIKAALWPSAIPCRAYLLAVLAETIINILIEAVVLQQINSLASSLPKDPASTSVNTITRQPVYLGIFVLAHVLQMVLAVDAVYNKNTLQFVFLAIFNFMLMVYGCIQAIEIRDNLRLYEGAAINAAVPINVLMISVPCVTAVAEVAYIALGWRISKEFGWKLYKFLGADRRIRAIFSQYQIFQCLLKFDIFFWVGFGVQWISLVLKNNDFEFYLTLAALPLSMLLLIQGHLAARHENKWMIFVFMFGCVAGVAYFVYKVYKVLSARDAFNHLWKSLLIFACISILLLITTFVWACIVLRNFGGGLKENMSQKIAEHKLERKATVYKGGRLGPPMIMNPKRMSIE